MQGWKPIIRAWGATRRGDGHDRNEDAFVLLDTPIKTRGTTDRGVILAVSDGVSTVSQGHWASELTCMRLGGFFDGSHAASEDTLVQLISEIDWEVRGERKGTAACTLAAVWLEGEALHVFQVGDSHVFRIRENKVEQITAGGLDEGARLEHFLGMGPEVAEVIKLSKADVRAGDVLVLVTDGVTASVSPDAMVQMWGEANEDPATACTSVIGAVARTGCEDDATVVMALVL